MRRHGQTSYFIPYIFSVNHKLSKPSLISIYVHVSVENRGNRRQFDRLTAAAAAVNVVGATNETIPEVKQSGQTWR